MSRYAALLVLEALTLQLGISVEKPAPHVAIIGGGIGGASTLHFLSELLNGNLEIDLYEAKTVGGRLATIKIDGDEFEAGGSIIHPKNMYMQRFVKLLGLEHSFLDDQKYGIWNGDEFVFTESNWSIISLLKLFYRYGFQPYKLKRHVENMIEDFVKIYDLQDAGQSFANVTDLLSAMNKDFPNLLQISIRDKLLHMGFTENLINELEQATIITNYGQEVDVHSFVGFISWAASGDLWTVKGGNKRVPEHLVYRTKNVNVMRNRVTKIRNLANINNSSRYEVTYTNKDGTDSITSNYDIVIIAAPLTKDQASQIEFIGFPDNLMFPGSYQITHVTFVKANLNPKYFGLQEILDGILSCNPNKTKISTVGALESVDGLVKKNPRVWKIFSRKPVESSLIHDMFSNVIEKKEIAWKAYPRYSTNLNFNNFKLHDALYYVNAIEWAASAMEMSAIAGRNVAILAHNDFLQMQGLNEEAIKDSTKKLHVSTEL
ncbi:prenylcysteine oxidase 1-like [Pogonomyrmex barbatus]|uniref:Prenylcysteine oxidase 1-like n=1 Tax=Pogonomyrmex barbatus TaxID=144034 RepID=A0A6I9WN65_9HYME|nr:prenylcysteine oxidase 1-like [Pogonomyrmex barbatus]